MSGSLNLYFYSLLLTAASSIGLGVLVLYKRPHSAVNRIWFLMSLAVAGWSYAISRSFFASSYSEGLYYSRLCNIIASYIPAFFFHFCLAITNHKSKTSRFLLVAAYVNCIIFGIFGFSDFFSGVRSISIFKYYASPGPLFYYYTFHFFLLSFCSEFLLFKSLKRLDYAKKNQIKFIIVGTTCGFVTGGMTFLTVYGAPINPVTAHFVWFYVAIISYAILKHQLMDIKVVIKRTIFYSALVFLVSVLYFAGVFVTHKLLVSEWSPQIYLADGLGFLRALCGKISKNPFVFTSFLCGLTSLGLAVFGMVVGNTKAQKLFVGFNTTVAMWGFGNFLAGISNTSHIAVLGWKLAYFGGFFISTFFCHMVQVFFGIKNNKILALAYLQSFVFSLLMVFYPKALIAHTRIAFGINYNAVTIAMAIAIGVFLLIVIWVYRELLIYLRSATGQRKIQAKYFIFGFAFGFVGGTTTLLPPFGIDVIYPAGNLGIAVYVFILVYAMFRYQVLDVQIAIKRTIVYSLLLVSISVFYILTIFVLHRLFLLENVFQPTFFNSVLAVLFIMLLLKPLEIFLRRFLDRKFFKGTITEIAEQKAQLETELERRERLKSVGILAAGMAHEIKNPITAIKTFAEYLPEKYENAEFRQKFTRIIAQETARIQEIVTNLLTFSKPAEPNKRECDVTKIIQDIAELLSSELLKNNIKCSFNFSSDTPLAYVDSDQMKQALLNILMNAIDAMKGRGGNLIVTTAREGKGPRIEIEDTGCGIAEDKLNHIFDPFFTDKEHGTGAWPCRYALHHREKWRKNQSPEPSKCWHYIHYSPALKPSIPQLIAVVKFVLYNI